MNNSWSGACLCAASVVAAYALALPVAAQDAVVAQVRTVTPHVTAYAQVEPVSTAPVDAAEAGVVAGLKAMPGMHVRAGQELARLSGPGLQTMLLQSEANVRSAQSQLDAARKALAIQREQLPAHLTTRQAVHQAEAAQAQAQAALENAQTHLNVTRQTMALTAPVSGLVLTLNAANGQLVSAGQPVVTLQPENALWLLANYYGADLRAIHAGMTGRFAPADGSPAVAVRVSTIPGTLTPGGGAAVALLPAQSSAAWFSGEAGTVTLDLPARTLVAVPTRALVLNQGKWWVMVLTPKGNRAQQVEPGQVQGWDTLIEHGLTPGAKVIVNNAYLLFHAGEAEQYQIPD